MGLVMRLPKLSLQGDRMGLQSAFNNLRRWSRCGSNSLKSIGAGAGGETPACAWFLANGKKSLQIMPPAVVHSIAGTAEFCRNGKEQRRQFLNATETKRRW